MTIRVEKRQQFAVVDSRTINDERLSMRARGVLVWLLEKPDGWRVSADAIARSTTEGRDAIRTALRELEEHGYLRRERTQDPETGQWSTESVVSELSGDNRERDSSRREPGVRSADVGEPGANINTQSQQEEPEELHSPSPAATDDTRLPEPTRPMPKGVDPEQVDALCELLAERVTAHRGTRPVISGAWRSDMATLLNSGGAGVADEPPTAEHVARVINATFDRLNVRSASGFCWADQVRAPSGLRNKWEQLRFALNHHRRTGQAPAEDVLAAMEQLDEMGVQK